MVSIGTIIISEAVGTGLLTLLGCGVVANSLLPKTKSGEFSWLLVNWGWGIGVLAGILGSYKSGGHINPAVTIGLLVSGADKYATGVPVTMGTTFAYLAGQLIGAFLGAVLVWLAYKPHFDEPAEPADKLGIFATGPEIRKPIWNLLTEVIATFLLVLVVLAATKFTHSILGPDAPTGWMGALGIALLVVGIGASLGGPTGYAINPARDLGPRLAHALLPIRGKGGSDWAYAWVPIVGPLLGAVLAGLLAGVLLP